jgi:hypothetical protein
MPFLSFSGLARLQKFFDPKLDFRVRLYNVLALCGSNSNRVGVKHMLNAFLLPKLGDRPIREITTREMLDLFLDMEKSVPSTAHRTRGIAERVFQFAVTRGDADLNIALGLRKTHVIRELG